MRYATGICLLIALAVVPAQGQSKKEQEAKLFEDWKNYYAGLEKVAEYKALDGAITAGALLANGKQLFIAGENGAALIVETATGKQVKKLAGHKESILDACVSKDGKYAATASSDDTVKVWDLSAGTEWRSLKHTSDVKSVAFSPDGKKLVAGCADGLIHLWMIMDSKDVKSLEIPRNKGEEKSPVRTVAWAGNGNYVMAGDEAGRYVAYDWKDYFPYVVGMGGKDRVTARVGFTPDSSHYFYVTSEGVGRVGSIDDKDNGAFLSLSNKPASVAISNNSRFMVVGFETGSASLIPLEYATGAERPGALSEHKSLEGHGDVISAVGFTPDGAKVVTCCRDGNVFLWASKDAAPGGASAGGANAPPLTKTLAEKSYAFLGVALSADGKTAVAGADDFTARVYDTSTGNLKVTLGGHTGAIRDCAYSPVEALCVTASDDKTLRVWNVAGGKEVRTITGHVDKVLSCQISKDGKNIISASADKSIRIWELVSGKQLRSSVMLGACDCACFAPDGKTTAGCSRDGLVKIWDAAGKEAKTLTLGASDFAQSLAFSPDGKKLVTLSRGGKLVIWDWASGTAEKTLEEGTTVEGTTAAPIAAASLAFSKDGAKLARSNANDIRVFNLADGSEKFCISGLGNGPFPLCMSQDGKMLVTGSGDGKVRVWDVQ